MDCTEIHCMGPTVFHSQSAASVQIAFTQIVSSEFFNVFWLIIFLLSLLICNENKC